MVENRLEEFIRGELFEELGKVYCGLQVHKNDMYSVSDHLTETTGDVFKLSWYGKEKIVEVIVPKIKHMLLDAIHRYRTGAIVSGFSWDQLGEALDAKNK